jgi:hypothetical protein
VRARPDHGRSPLTRHCRPRSGAIRSGVRLTAHPRQGASPYSGHPAPSAGAPAPAAVGRYRVLYEITEEAVAVRHIVHGTAGWTWPEDCPGGWPLAWMVAMWIADEQAKWFGDDAHGRLPPHRFSHRRGGDDVHAPLSWRWQAHAGVGPARGSFAGDGRQGGNGDTWKSLAGNGRAGGAAGPGPGRSAVPSARCALALDKPVVSGQALRLPDRR